MLSRVKLVCFCQSLRTRNTFILVNYVDTVAILLYDRIDIVIESGPAINKKLMTMNPLERDEFVKVAVLDTAGSILGSADTIPLDAPLQELGIDSLGAVEFRNSLQKS